MHSPYLTWPIFQQCGYEHTTLLKRENVQAPKNDVLLVKITCPPSTVRGAPFFLNTPNPTTLHHSKLNAEANTLTILISIQLPNANPPLHQIIEFYLHQPSPHSSV